MSCLGNFPHTNTATHTYEFCSNKGALCWHNNHVKQFKEHALQAACTQSWLHCKSSRGACMYPLTSVCLSHSTQTRYWQDFDNILPTFPLASNAGQQCYKYLSLPSYQLSMLATSPSGYQCWLPMLPLPPLPVVINAGHNATTQSQPIGYQQLLQLHQQQAKDPFQHFI